MADGKLATRTVSYVILDLDGTLLNTDGIVNEVLKVFLLQYGKKWDSKKAHRIVGMTPLEAVSLVVKDYELPCTIEEFISAITPMFLDQWCNIKALAGATRLIKHMRNHEVPMALASNSPKSNIKEKISFHQGWKESFSVIIGGDEVAMGKPSPEIFVEAAKRMNADPSNCLVLEDSLPGVMAGKAAGMVVIAVPSIPKQGIEDTLPIEPCYFGGPVIRGFGRGLKILGIPTANLSAENFSAMLSEHNSGVYFGWAGLSTRGIYKMVMSIGWNPYFDNTEKTIEPWLLHDFDENFYGEELRLAVVGYIRPEANFPSLESLIARIHEDRRIVEKALDLPIYVGYKESPFLRTPCN
ncbi:bifunctional riboflavin kinase/FMN phosphatase-like isoform X2 [Musa acuminata AAA Group]|uniref:bifunctional riboflavin kinase/FMN phosphatase-like isoform X2 n=1 Tax=Musa acuminata AAA Group TaxID=214697 RepID=UPI0031D1529F